MAKDLAIVLCDGGVNSSVAAMLAAQKYRLITMNADLGGQAESRKRAAYDMLVGHLRPYREHTLGMNYLAWVKRSSPAGTGMGVDPRTISDISPKLTELAPLIATAIRFAAHYQAVAIYAGIRVGPEGVDLARVTEFAQIWNELAQHGCGLSDLEIVFPLAELEPWQVIDLGVQVGCPMDKTWSCDQENAEPCGVCPGCRGREAAFEQAAKVDPLKKR